LQQTKLEQATLSISARAFVAERQMHGFLTDLFNSYSDMQFMSSSMVEPLIGSSFLERECIPVKDDKSPLDAYKHVSPTHLSVPASA